MSAEPGLKIATLAAHVISRLTHINGNSLAIQNGVPNTLGARNSGSI